jgi:hypothetical protein
MDTFFFDTENMTVLTKFYHCTYRRIFIFFVLMYI